MNLIRFQDLCIQGKVAGMRVFIRADLNVPQDASGAITEDTRIRASIPCIRMALDAGAAVMLTSHLGRPTEGQWRSEDSLAPVAHFWRCWRAKRYLPLKYWHAAPRPDVHRLRVCRV